jgi:hypothetical protein
MNTHFIHWYIFATLLALCTVYGVAFMTPEVPFGDVVQEDGTTVYQSMSHGYQHPVFPKMDIAGSGAVRHEKTIWVGWALGLCFVLFWTGLLAFGTARDGNIGPAKIPLIVGCVLFMGIITALIFFYRAFMNGDHSTFLSLPKPLALMIYGIWPFPLYFVIVYHKIFDSWHFTDEDQRRFEEIVANRRHATSEDH